MFNFDPNDPRQAGLMSMALALMGSKGNIGQAIGQSGQQGLMAYQGAQQNRMRSQEEEQQRKMRQLQMDAMEREARGQAAVDSVYASNTMPGNMGIPNDDDGNPMPAAPQGFNMQGLQSGLMGAGRAGLREAATIQGLLQKQQPKYHSVGGALVPEPKNPGEKTHPVYEAPREQWVDAGKDPRTGQMLQKNAVTGQIRAVGGVAPSVTVTNIGEREEQKGLGKLRVDAFAGVQGLAASARKENALLTGLERIPLETGKLTPANATVAAWLTAAGAKDADLQRIASGAQTFEAFTNDLVMQQQLAQKGPQTESDAKRLEMTQARLSNTPEANKLNITYRKAMNNRTIAQERHHADWLKKKGTLEGADDDWFNGKGGTSIWDEPELKKFQGRGNVIDFNQLPP